MRRLLLQWGQRSGGLIVERRDAACAVGVGVAERFIAAPERGSICPAAYHAGRGICKRGGGRAADVEGEQGDGFANLIRRKAGVGFARPTGCRCVGLSRRRGVGCRVPGYAVDRRRRRYSLKEQVGNKRSPINAEVKEDMDGVEIQQFLFQWRRVNGDRAWRKYIAATKCGSRNFGSMHRG
jgi:hypothetical protein